ncbi:MAG: prepilin-type N-terminal cleavage/methylation domain-containing protein [Coxiellaceae bacterium]|nr:prepilin-type N-terminal cleavage/methylation domain-containing protein [Coxiellaceae bacterium]
MKNAIKQKQSAFTLVELIIVIVILGILSAFAIPKFIDYKNDARQAVINSISGSLQSAINMIHAKAILKGIQNQASSSVTLGDGTRVETAYGYPAGNARGLPQTMSQHFPREIVSHPSGGNSWMFTNSDSSNCYVRYSQPTQGSPYRLLTHADCGSGSQ